jgi:hypothetical protein
LKRLRYFLRPALIVVILTFAGSSGYSVPPVNKKDTKRTDPKLGLPYLTVSAGAGLLYISWQEGMGSRYFPISLAVEYGRTAYPLSLYAGTSFRTTFNIKQFLLNPNNLLLGLQYAPLRGTQLAKKFNLYVIGGFNFCYARFTEELYPGILNYDYKIERKAGVGLGSGIGVGYRIKSWEIKPLLYYFTGQADFFAGHFTPQKFNTGSMQFHLTLNYRIIFNKNNRTCPVYYKYRKL